MKKKKRTTTMTMKWKMRLSEAFVVEMTMTMTKKELMMTMRMTNCLLALNLLLTRETTSQLTRKMTVQKMLLRCCHHNQLLL